MAEVVWPKGLEFQGEGHAVRYSRYISLLPGRPDVYWQAAVYVLAAAKPELAERLAAKINWAHAEMPDLWEDGTLSQGEKRFARSLAALLRNDPVTLYDFFNNAYADVLLRAARWLYQRVG